MFLSLAWYWWIVILAVFIISIPFKVKVMRWWGRREQEKKKEQRGKWYDWFWEILFEKYAKGNKCGIWISYIHVYEKQRYMGVCS